MEEIKIGEYIRTDSGEIFIVDEISWYEKEGLYFYDSPKNCGGCWSDQVKKHSQNIIDLIEFGDYVNGYRVKYVCNDELCPSKYVDIDCELDSSESFFFESEIQLIVTKEQFASIEYEVEKIKEN